MEITVSRETFLRALETAAPGLSPKEILEQSGCFVFVDGDVVTYNDEVSVRGPSGLPNDFRGAVRAKKLLDLLRGMDEDGLRLSEGDAEFVVTGKSRQAAVRMEKEIHLPYAGVEPPGKFKKLPEEFGEAVSLVQQCAGTDESRFVLTCVNIHPDWIEACDDFRACRWKMQTGFKNPTLVKQASMSPAARMGVESFSEGDNWVHFKNRQGYVLSARKFVEEFPSASLDGPLSQNGTPVSLPKGVKEAAEKAQLFSADNLDADLAEVTLKAGRVVVRGRGPEGWYKEVKKVTWDGPAVTFMIPPKLLGELVEKYNSVEVSESVLRIDGGSYVYITCLTAPEG